jgi:hypothetical protein
MERMVGEWRGWVEFDEAALRHCFLDLNELDFEQIRLSLVEKCHIQTYSDLSGRAHYSLPTYYKSGASLHSKRRLCEIWWRCW